MGQALSARYESSANVVTWDWNENAATLSPATASGRTESEGTALARTLMDTLGPGYQRQIHFVGHSLGTLVNRAAADYLHGARRPRGDTRPATQRYFAARTHVTLLDQAELVTAVNGLHVSLDLLLAISGYPTALSGTADYVRVAQAMPENAAWIDNYISLVGILHSRASNVMLWRSLGAPNPVASHGYAYDWYQQTITTSNPAASTMGHRWSFERNTLGTPPATGGQPAAGKSLSSELGTQHLGIVA